MSKTNSTASISLLKIKDNGLIITNNLNLEYMNKMYEKKVMNTQEFFDKWNNVGCDFDGYYGNQCMDLANQYNQDVLQAPRLTGNAVDVWTTYPKDYYDKIENTPNGVPEMGDIIIWGQGVGQYGHIAVFDHGDQNTFTSFDQNWPLNSLCHYQNHNYNGVLGWLHPKKTDSGIIPPSGEMNDQTKIPKALLGEDQDLEIQQIRGLLADGKRDNIDLVNCRAENEQLKKDLQTCQERPPEVRITADLSQVSISDLLIAAIKKIFK